MQRINAESGRMLNLMLSISFLFPLTIPRSNFSELVFPSSIFATLSIQTTFSQWFVEVLTNFVCAIFLAKTLFHYRSFCSSVPIRENLQNKSCINCKEELNIRNNYNPTRIDIRWITAITVYRWEWLKWS